MVYIIFARIFQICSMPAGYEELAGGFEPIKNSNIFSMANNIVCLFVFVGNSVFCTVLNNLVPCRKTLMRT